MLRDPGIEVYIESPLYFRQPITTSIRPYIFILPRRQTLCYHDPDGSRAIVLPT